MSKKQQRDLELFIVDLFVAIFQVKHYTKDFKTQDDFRHSSLHWDASIRQLEIIGEALNKLLEDDSFNAVSPKYFRKIVNFRNAINHGYFGIDAYEVWNVIQEKLDILHDDLTIIVNENFDLEIAIQTSLDEYKALEETSIVKLLLGLQRTKI